MAIFLRYAAMFRVGMSFIFSRIKSRSASVTLNLICTVLLRPSMLSLLSVPRVWDTSQQAIFNRRAAAREGENTEVVPASYACYECFYPLGSYHLLRRKSDFAKLTQKKNAATSKKITTLSKSCSVLSRTFLFALFFDFGNLLCRCGYNPYACIAHTVKKRVKLPPLRVLLRRRF